MIHKPLYSFVNNSPVSDDADRITFERVSQIPADADSFGARVDGSDREPCVRGSMNPLPSGSRLRPRLPRVVRSPFAVLRALLSPSGQTVVYKTPGDDLRTGTLDTSPFVGTRVTGERHLTSTTDQHGNLTLSPNASEVAYIEGTDLVIDDLTGGTRSYSRQEIANGLPGGGGGLVERNIEHGTLVTVAWCRATGSDRLALIVSGGYETNPYLLLVFDRSTATTQVFNVRPDVIRYGLAWSPTCAEIVYSDDGQGVDVLDVSTDTHGQRIRHGFDLAWGTTGIGYRDNGDVYLLRGSGTVQLTSAAATDYGVVIFEQQGGETLAFVRNDTIHLVERIDRLGANPTVSLTTVATDRDVTTAAIGA